MIIPSAITTQTIKYWVPTYMVLMVHGSTITPLPEFLEIFVIYPALCGAIMATYTFFRNMDLDEMEEKAGIEPTENVVLGISLYIAGPVAFVVAMMFLAQFLGGYESIDWVVIVFGGLTLDQVALKARELKHRK
jgi:hypothetical protein